MSAAKRDNYEFRQELASGHTVSRSSPPKAASRPDPSARTLGLQVSWKEGTRQGSDPYNSCGARTRS
jgi:hypothetical protein